MMTQTKDGVLLVSEAVSVDRNGAYSGKDTPPRVCVFRDVTRKGK